MSHPLDAFIELELRSPWLRAMLVEVLAVVGEHRAMRPGALGRLHEGPTRSGEAGEVNLDGSMILDAALLRRLPRAVAEAIVAHEIAHRVLGHGSPDAAAWLEAEAEADALAASWGFDIDELRRVFGPASL
jgi:hypothetical protein